jgi:hypothetical protein
MCQENSIDIEQGELDAGGSGKSIDTEPLMVKA